MKFLIVVLALVCAVYAESDEDWARYQRQYGKYYRSAVEATRRRVNWENNWKIIREHNEEYAKGLQTYTLGENEFADMSYEEFGSEMLNLKAAPIQFAEYHTQSARANPISYDLRSNGWVRAIKNQGSCGSCWAFGTTAAVEVLYARQNGQLIDLSEQQLVDCSNGTATYTNLGCKGGWLEPTFVNIKAMGQQTQASYPYTGTDGVCKYDKTKVAFTINGAVGVLNENDLEDAVAAGNAVVIGVYASFKFQLHKTGIYTPSGTENNSAANHAITVVGYDKSGSVPFWIIRNSWGTTWGESGYVRLPLGKDSLGMVRNQMACYPN